MKLLVVLFLSILFFPIYGQEVFISANSEPTNRNMYTKVLGENAFGLYVLQFKNYDLSGGFSIVQYANNLNVNSKQDFKLDRGEKALKFIVKDSFIICITQSRKKIMQFKIAPNLQTINPMFPEFGTEKLEINEDVIVKYSLNRKFVSIAIPSINSNNKLDIILVNRSLTNDNFELKKTIHTDFSWRDCNIVDLAVNDYGGYSLVIRKSKSVFDEEDYSYYWYTEKEDKPELLNENEILKSIKTIFHPITNAPFLFALFTNEIKNNSKGILYKNLGDSALKTYFKQETLQATEGSKTADGVQNLFIREIVANEGNNFTIVLEKYIVNKQIETYFVNGIQQSATKNTYNYDDIVIVQLNDNAIYNWETVIQKKQISMGTNNYYCSFVMLAADNSLYFILNELLSSDNRVLMYQVNKYGEKSLKELIQANSNNALALPVEAKQVNANSVVFPFIGNRSSNLVRVNVP